MTSFDEIYEAHSFRFHQLSGQRQGQYALRLTGRWRLIVSQIEPNELMIEEVIDYHD